MQVSPELWYHRLGTTYVVAQIMFHLNQLGLISRLADHGPATAADLAKALKLDPVRLESVLRYLVNVDQVMAVNAEQKFHFTDFGLQVLKRYSRVEKNFTIYNFHEVRVGAYGPVWDAMGDLMSGKKVYGQNVKRRGEFAETGVYAQALKFRPSLLEAVNKSKCRAAVEFGANTGLTEQLSDVAGLELFCLDRSNESLRQAEERFNDRTKGKVKANWVETDIFDSSKWLPRIKNHGPILIFSIHFHELIAKGPQVATELMKSIKASGIKGHVVAFEQPLITEKPDVMSEALWLYAQSNVLIHHFIGNGRILTREEWQRTFEAAGCRLVHCESAGFLGYESFLFEI